ncbi:MAG: hypothetical protein JWN44_3699 [Myxococcales bacterium]|nr:hypothetical protein [Myxococcales bacterium]
MIREGMIVRTPDGERVGRIASVGADDFVIERGHVFKHRFRAPLEHVIAVDDEKDELICRPLELPEQDRAFMEMPFGSPETPDEMENRRREANMAEELLHDPHLDRS